MESNAEKWKKLLPLKVGSREITANDWFTLKGRKAGFPHFSCNACPRTGKEHMRKPCNDAGIEKKRSLVTDARARLSYSVEANQIKGRYAKPRGNFY